MSSGFNIANIQFHDFSLKSSTNNNVDVIIFYKTPDTVEIFSKLIHRNTTPNQICTVYFFIDVEKLNKFNELYNTEMCYRTFLNITNSVDCKSSNCRSEFIEVTVDDVLKELVKQLLRGVV